ncbi:hypothetical protein B0H14DRAFT_2656195 [Mycena olivaceomarginata]|nr:hypothetical protein B0H14DRAFT_2656195 [Mycena olivaceomarginata]
MILSSSSAPSSPTFWDNNNKLLIDETPSHAPTPLQLQLPPLQDSPLPETPPTSPSGGGPLTSPFWPSPVKAYSGRPHISAPHRSPRGIRGQKQMPEWKDLQEAQETAAHVKVQMLQLEAERDAAQKRDRAKQKDVYSVLEHLTSDGTPHAQNPRTERQLQCFATHGPELLDKWVERAPESVDAFLSKCLADLVQHEGQAIQNYLTRTGCEAEGDGSETVGSSHCCLKYP